MGGAPGGPSAGHSCRNLPWCSRLRRCPNGSERSEVRVCERTASAVGSVPRVASGACARWPLTGRCAGGFARRVSGRLSKVGRSGPSVVLDGGLQSTGARLVWRASRDGGYLVDPASSHMLVSKTKPCMSKYKRFCTVKLRMAH